MQNKNLKAIKEKFWKEGWVIFNINNNKIINLVNEDIKKIVKKKQYKTNTKIYSYNNSPRIVESYKLSKNCKKLAKLNIIKKTIEYIYNDKAAPFSTINFIKSTQQPLHSDYAHFGTIPENKIVGAWIALEDINPNSGPLQIVPFSHKLKNYNFLQHSKKPLNLIDLKKNYLKYEKWVKKIIKTQKLKILTPVMKSGDCLLWESNMLHGSPKCKNPKLSRLSQVTHWTFKSVRKHYNPNFSDPQKKNFVFRSIATF